MSARKSSPAARPHSSVRKSKSGRPVPFPLSPLPFPLSPFPPLPLPLLLSLTCAGAAVGGHLDEAGRGCGARLAREIIARLLDDAGIGALMEAHALVYACC